MTPNYRVESQTKRIPLSELTEDANHGHARVVRERGVCVQFANVIANLISVFDKIVEVDN